MSHYASHAGAVFSLKYHLVWCAKYRRPVLSGTVEQWLRALLRQKTDELGLIIHVLEILPDHVHWFLEADPTRCVAEIVNRLKGFTLHVRRHEFPSLRSRLPTLSSRRSYYAGAVSEARLGSYIEAQSKT